VISQLQTPALFLEGKLLKNNWVVKSPIQKTPLGTGGNFSYSYFVENSVSGEKAFLKALDFSMALRADDPLKAMSKLTQIFNFEQNILEICQSKKLSRIITIVEAGNVPPDPNSSVPVPYLIMELADGDIYSQLDFSSSINHSLNLTILHGITVALYQLHNLGISHQDVKPSNILVLKKKKHKLGDLGRADIRGEVTPFGMLAFAGDPSYAPPEALYKSVQADWVFRRIASDTYQLGSMIIFLYTQMSMTTIMKQFINPEHNWNNWTQSYREVLPYLYVALEQSIDYFKEYVNDEDLAISLGDLVYQLCDPNPTRRGHPKTINSINSTISLERYISTFDRLIRRFEIKRVKS
jgi:serine/threonine protein kinase